VADAAGANFQPPQATGQSAASNGEPSSTASPPALQSAAESPSSPPPTKSSLSQTASTDANHGRSVFESTCIACHGTGVAGAPKFGDKNAWGPRISKGIETLHQHALHGFQGKSGVMPPKGGNTALADSDVIAAVDYMVSQAK
jgi:cytochrome c5